MPFLVLLALFTPGSAAAFTYLDPVEEATCLVTIQEQSRGRYQIEAIAARNSYASAASCTTTLAEDGLSLGDTVSINGIKTSGTVFNVPFSLEFSGSEDDPAISVHFYAEAAESVSAVAGDTSVAPSMEANGKPSTAISDQIENSVILIYQQMIPIMQKLVYLYGLLER